MIRAAILRLPILFILYDIFIYFGMEMAQPLPPIRTILVQWLIALVVNDTLFYWTHRLMHHRWFYKLIHKKHHEFKVRSNG